MSYGQQGYGGGYGGRGPHGAPYGANEYGSGWRDERHGGGYGGSGSELLYSPEFAEAVMRVCRERMDEVLAEQGYFPAGMQGAGFDHERHHRFKEVLEELRDLPVAEAQRQMAGRFNALSDEQKRVLSVLASEASKKKLAQKANVPLERFMQLKHELEDKLK